MHFRCTYLVLVSTLLSLILQINLVASTWTTLKTPTTTYLAGLTSVNSDQHVITLHSIPYAKPPTGNLRFRPPQPLTRMPSFIDARSLPATCMQMPHMKTAASELLSSTASERVSEDCLYLSIYIPIRGSIDHLASNRSSQLTTEHILQRNLNQSLPVLAWFAGEGYDFADARQFDGSALAAQTNSIVVSIQYRVGVFGFLRVNGLNDGNQALWDQVAALQWLQTYLPSLAGNRDSVTAAGRFTGSMALSILLTSPILANRRLFNRAVLISGIATGDWVFDNRPDQRLETLSQQLKCSTSNITQQVQCLQNTSAEQLLATSGFGWKPVYDGRLVVGQPITLLESGLFAANVTDVLIGSTENDGSLCFQTQQAINSQAASAIDSGHLDSQTYLQLIKQDLNMFYDGRQSSVSPLYQLMTKTVHRNTEASYKYIRFCSQLLIHSHQDRFARLLRGRTHVSTYRLMYQPSVSSSPAVLNKAAFGDDVLLAFGQWSLASDRKMAANFRSMLGAFVHNGIAGLPDSDSNVHLSIPSASLLSSDSFSSPSGVSVSDLSASDLSNNLELFSSAIELLHYQLQHPANLFGLSCQPLSTSGPKQNTSQPLLLNSLFASASDRNVNYRVTCTHLTSKSDFLRLVDHSIMPTMLPFYSS